MNSNSPVQNPSIMSRSVIERSNALDDKKSALDFWKQSRVKMKSASRSLSKWINLSLTEFFIHRNLLYFKILDTCLINFKSGIDVQEDT